MLKKIGHFLKEFILVTVRPRLILNLFKVRNFDENYNKVLGNDRMVRLLSVILAILFVITARVDSTPVESATTIYRTLPLDVRLDTDNYTYFGSTFPPLVNVHFSGDADQLELLSRTGELYTIEVFVDLMAYLELNAPGSVVIQTSWDNHPLIAVTVDPSVITDVQVAQLVEKELPISLLAQNPPELEAPYHLVYTLEVDEVTVKGPEAMINEISTVNAVLDLSDAINVHGGERSYELSAIVIAYDSLGMVVEGITFDPSTIDVHISIEADMEARLLQPTIAAGTTPANVVIESLIPDIESFYIWGNVDLVNETFTIPLDFDDFNTNNELTINLQDKLPTGVYTNTETITVTLTYSTRTPNNTNTSMILNDKKERRS